MTRPSGSGPPAPPDTLEPATGSGAVPPGATRRAVQTSSAGGATRRWGWLLDAVERRLESIRTRLLVFFLVIFALSAAGSILVAREVQYNRLGDRIDAELGQETQELAELAGGVDPETGEPFGDDTRRIFEVFLSRTIPARYEAMIAIPRDGGPPLRTTDSDTPPLDSYVTAPDLLGHWRTLDAPERDSTQTRDGQLEWLAVTLARAGGGGVSGVFVVAINHDLAAREVREATATAAGVSLTALVVGSILVWSMTGQLLLPIRRMTGTARAISDTDLTRRIPVEGKDEISGLAATFNAMLDRLEAAFVAQRQFIDDAGHELRTPITVVRGHIELLDHADPVDREQTAALVLDELDRMHRFVEDLLLLAKAEQPDFLRLDPVDLEALTREIGRKCAAIASRQWQVTRVGRGVVVVDRQRLTQAAMQLAQNAVDHTAVGTRIEIGSRLAEGDAHLWVADDGPGIPVGDHERVFDRFARGADGRRGSGAGLGLSIVRAIAEAHGGRVELTSTVGDGARFTIVLPIDPPARPPATT